MIETEPYGSVVVGSFPSVRQYDFGSPSLADKTNWPSGEKVTWSGREPTSTPLGAESRSSPSVSARNTLPGAWEDVMEAAIAMVPFLAATL